MSKQYIDKEKVEDILRNLWKEDDGSNSEHRICYNTAIQEVQNKIDELNVHEEFGMPDGSVKDAIEVKSRLKYIDKDLMPIADFIMDYASWNLHKDEWNQPVIEVPLFRVLDALSQKGKPYCCS